MVKWKYYFSFKIK